MNFSKPTPILRKNIHFLAPFPYNHIQAYTISCIVILYSTLKQPCPISATPSLRPQAAMKSQRPEALSAIQEEDDLPEEVQVFCFLFTRTQYVPNFKFQSNLVLLLIFRSFILSEIYRVCIKCINYHTSYLSRIPRIYSCKFFLAGVNFYRFNAKNLHFRQILREKVAFFFTDLTRKIGVFRCKFYSPKILPV